MDYQDFKIGDYVQFTHKPTSTGLVVKLGTNRTLPQTGKKIPTVWIRWYDSNTKRYFGPTLLYVSLLKKL